ncbi:MAG: AAA family ATPase, partial [Dehalococcoidales bacterium]|nr:AAA family ATPase [Dehalococcoidales bacterium]
IRPYTSIEFINVVEQVLIKHESLSVEDAHEIAIRIIGKTNSIRDAVRIARLSKNIGVKRAIELIVE